MSFDKCTSLTHGLWLYGTTGSTGLCNQLSAVYAWARVAQVLNATGLLLGPMYSRHNFDQHYNDFQHEKNRHQLPFAAFFDADHYKSFWATRGMTVLSLQHVKHCLAEVLVTGSMPLRYTPVVLPHFFTYTDEELRELVRNATGLPLDSAAPPLAHVVEFKPSLVAAYNFHALGTANNYSDYHAASDSLIPSSQIQLVVSALLSALPTSFTAVHLRVEADVVESMADFNTSLSYYVKAAAERNSSEHVAYLASGIFQANVNPERANIALAAFEAAGVHITHREALAAAAAAAATSETAKLQELLAGMTPEQLAMVDLQVMRHAPAVVLPQTPGSTFSYMVKRLQELDTGGPLTMDGIPEAHKFFYSWGMRSR
jgi:hypothetical protein